MKPALIPSLLEQLKRVASTDSLRNPYDASECLQNLRVYLETLCSYPYSGHLLIGEAPGHKGCALTGIPFTSQRVLSSSTHPFIIELQPSLSVSGNVTEASATVVWDYLSDCSAVPAMWNVFPFHPHKPGNLQSNRTPKTTEVHTGRRYVELILDILRPTSVIAVGRTSATAMGHLFPDLGMETVGHPSFGGKADFLAGVGSAGIV
ncbi:MAG: uracil-DNA glycosylase [Planctomycetota bacterium]